MWNWGDMLVDDMEEKEEREEKEEKGEGDSVYCDEGAFFAETVSDEEDGPKWSSNDDYGSDDEIDDTALTIQPFLATTTTEVQATPPMTKSTTTEVTLIDAADAAPCMLKHLVTPPPPRPQRGKDEGAKRAELIKDATDSNVLTLWRTATCGCALHEGSCFSFLERNVGGSRLTDMRVAQYNRTPTARCVVYLDHHTSHEPPSPQSDHLSSVVFY